MSRCGNSSGAAPEVEVKGGSDDGLLVRHLSNSLSILEMGPVVSLWDSSGLTGINLKIGPSGAPGRVIEEGEAEDAGMLVPALELVLTVSLVPIIALRYDLGTWAVAFVNLPNELAERERTGAFVKVEEAGGTVTVC